MKPLAVALRGKGIRGLIKRVLTINDRYGFTPGKMRNSLKRFGKILDQYHASATFPIPGIVVSRNPKLLSELKNYNMEFALHGYTHIDHSLLSFERQVADFKLGKQKLDEVGIECSGFRSPYLRHTPDTIAALQKLGFLYDGSQGISWDVVNGEVKGNLESYERALKFYRAVPAKAFPSLPRLENGLVRIPYSLPDDESLVDRFKLTQSSLMSQLWLQILHKSYESGELFTLGLHPERIKECEGALISTLQEARSMKPHVWIASQSEIARWWIDRLNTSISITRDQGGMFELESTGPPGLTILVRNMEMVTPQEPWDGVYNKAAGLNIKFFSDKRPFIGLSEASDAALESFLRQQGYIIERSPLRDAYSFYLDCPSFEAQDERNILDTIENSSFPLVRLGRWPDAARSVLSISGDIEGITIWDYSLRFFGK